MDPMQSVLLPDEVHPQKYRLTLTPDFEKFLFSGEVEIELDVQRSTRRIVLHSAELHIRTVECTQGEAARRPERILIDERRETATFEFAEDFEKGPAVLRILYAGQLNDRMCGFYRSEALLDGKKRILAVTQFEATDARRAFPCWDEPALKAGFEVRLVIPPDRKAISNMPVVEEGLTAEGRTVVRFAETPVMSTYLLAFVVGDFDFLEARTKEGVQVRVYTPVGKREQGRFALEVAARALSFFQGYFDVPYPLPKMDLIAIPDFAAGAMENWGAVTYRETAILVDPEHSSAATRQRVAMVVAHELAHQWFGNLVTMQWWTHLWLNEGFASYLQYLAVDRLFPDWDVWTQFVSNEYGRALKLDCLVHSHPIEVEVKDPAEISEIFDAISYSKGAAVIRMLAALLGEEALRRGLHLYLTRHSYGNATTEDLWRAFSEASGRPVKEIMDTWTRQTGYPVISLDAVAAEPGSQTLRQSRFLSLGSSEANASEESLWCVPVSIRTEGSSSFSHFLLQRRDARLDCPLEPPQWIKLNVGQTGFYRVSYPQVLWKRLFPAVFSGTLPPADRLGLQSDAFALARAGFCPTAQVLDLLMAYRAETDYTVWADLSSNLTEWSLLACDEPFYGHFAAFARFLYRPIAARLGWDSKPGEGHLDTLLRGLVIEQLGHFQDASILSEARRRFETFRSSGEGLPPDQRFPVYRMVVESAPAEAYEQVLAVFRRTDLNEEKVRCLRALGYAPEKALIQRTLEFSLSPEVRPQDAVFVLGSVGSNPMGREAAWAFLRERWSEFQQRYGKGGFLIARLIASTTQNFVTEEKAREVHSFFLAHPAPAAERTIQQAVERIRSNRFWLDRDRESIRRWLEDFSPSDPAEP
jgi:puromycin-sensitive aminopeptidase